MLDFKRICLDYEINRQPLNMAKYNPLKGSSYIQVFIEKLNYQGIEFPLTTKHAV